MDNLRTDIRYIGSSSKAMNHSLFNHISDVLLRMNDKLEKLEERISFIEVIVLKIEGSK